jgi:hypothetical protein
MLVVMAALVAYDRLKGWLQALGEQRMNNKHPIDRAFDLVMWGCRCWLRFVLRLGRIPALGRLRLWPHSCGGTQFPQFPEMCQA